MQDRTSRFHTSYVPMCISFLVIILLYFVSICSCWQHQPFHVSHFNPSWFRISGSLTFILFPFNCSLALHFSSSSPPPLSLSPSLYRAHSSRLSRSTIPIHLHFSIFFTLPSLACLPPFSLYTPLLPCLSAPLLPCLPLSCLQQVFHLHD